MENENEGQKFKNKFEINYEDFMMARFLPMLGVIKKFISEFGEEKTLQLVEEYIDELAFLQVNELKEKKKIENFSQFKIVIMSMLNTNFMKNATTFEIVEDSENKLELRYTECLWAKVFNQLDFDDECGYRTACRADYSIASTLHPNVSLSIRNTLMQGDEFCRLIYTWEEN